MSILPTTYEDEEPGERPAPRPRSTSWRPPQAVDWTTLEVGEAEAEFRHLDDWVTWLKTTFGLPPAVVPPMWHRHDELIWELSALHTAFLDSYGEMASASAPLRWMREFADARIRLREWTTVNGTRLDRDRATRITTWPGEPPTTPPSEVDITDRWADFEDFVHEDSLQRLRDHNPDGEPAE